MTRPLLALAALLLASAARAGWEEDAVKDWSENILPAESFDWVRFHDEENVERTLFCKKAPHRYMSFAVQSGCQLYAFPPNPPTEVREMTSTWHHGTETMSVDVLIVRGAQVSPYYIHTADGGGGWIGRRDRPETRLPITWSAESYYPKYFPWPPTQWSKKQPSRDQQVLSTNGVIPWGRIQVYKPAGVSSAARSPLTELLPYETCSTIDGSWENKPEPYYQIQRGWIPQEIELWAAKLDPAVAPPGIWNAQHKAAEEGVRRGDFAPAAEYHRWYRTQARAAVGNIGAASSAASAPKDRLTPLESRFLICRANHVKKKDALFAAIEALGGDAAKTEAFVSQWRGYIRRELELYLRDAAAAPSLPSLPDHAAIDRALHERFDQALAGRVAGAPVQQASNRRADEQRTRRRVESAAKSALQLLE